MDRLWRQEFSINTKHRSNTSRVSRVQLKTHLFWWETLIHNELVWMSACGSARYCHQELVVGGTEKHMLASTKMQTTHLTHTHTQICIRCFHICRIGVLGLRASVLVIIHSWAGAKVCVSCGWRSLQISLVRVGFAKQCSWCSWLCAPSVSQCTFYLSHPSHNLLRCACIYSNYI